MINPQELRIGNYISNKKDILFNVLPEDIETISKFPDNYNPIPLTEEWLLRLGFHKGSIPEPDGSRCYYKGMLDVIFKTSNGFIYSNHKPSGHTKIEYLHQLQNLYFALTGVELELK